MANSDRVMLQALGWTDEQIDDGLKSIANTIVVDIPIKRKPLVEKFGYYQESIGSILHLFFMRAYVDLEILSHIAIIITKF